MYLPSQWGCLGGPKIVSIPDPYCEPSAAELISRTLGPVRELDTIRIIGGQPSHEQAADLFGP
jgi:hypothetical protein